MKEKKNHLVKKKGSRIQEFKGASEGIKNMSRTVKVKSKVFNIRSLTRGEIKDLREDGMNLAALTVENANEAQDRAAELMLSKSQLEQYYKMEPKETLPLWIAIMKETYGAKDEEKNLPKSGAGSQTKKE